MNANKEGVILETTQEVSEVMPYTGRNCWGYPPQIIDKVEASRAFLVLDQKARQEDMNGDTERHYGHLVDLLGQQMCISSGMRYDGLRATDISAA